MTIVMTSSCRVSDDENDHLCLMAFAGDRWTYVKEVKVTQAKVDLLTFDLDVSHDRSVCVGRGGGGGGGG